MNPHHHPSAPSAANVEVSSALEPQDADVLFGRGRAHVRHPGNKALHGLTNHYTAIYKEFSRSSLGAVKRKKQYGVASKQEIVDTIIDQIHQQGGRFLRRQEDDRNLWRQVDNNEARAKVSHILRGKERRRYNRPRDVLSPPKRNTGVPDSLEQEISTARMPREAQQGPAVPVLPLPSMEELLRESLQPAGTTSLSTMSRTSPSYDMSATSVSPLVAYLAGLSAAIRPGIS